MFAFTIAELINLLVIFTFVVSLAAGKQSVFCSSPTHAFL
jgi:hypothetical protein